MREIIIIGLVVIVFSVGYFLGASDERGNNEEKKSNGKKRR
jgi:hypothetical protein